MSRKRRRIKKKSIILLFVLIILLIFIVILLQNHKPNVVDKNVKDVEKFVNNNGNDVKKMSLIAVGDVLIHESVYKDAKTDNGYDFKKMFTMVKPIISKYDLKYCNQESIIGGSALGISGYPAFNSPDEIGDEMVNDLGFNLISLANNHLLDKGIDAVNYSNSYWKKKNVITAGSYSSMDERNDIKVYKQNGIRYAFLAYTTISNGKVPNNKDYLLNMYSDEQAKKDIDTIKDQVDVIIVSMHWGVEFSNTPNSEQKKIAEYLSSLGVNIIIGSHPHVVQPVEYVNNTLVIYSLGNFISNQLSLELNYGIGLMVGVDIVVDKNGVSFDNLYKELILSYSDNSKNFKVIPFSKLNDNYLSNYKDVENKYLKIVEGN